MSYDRILFSATEQDDVEPLKNGIFGFLLNSIIPKLNIFRNNEMCELMLLVWINCPYYLAFGFYNSFSCRSSALFYTIFCVTTPPSLSCVN